MTKEETTKILATINAAYPQAYANISDKVKANMINLWAGMFEDDDYNTVGKAVKNYLANDTKGFMPPIGAIKEEVRKIMYPNELTEQEAVNIILDRLSWRSSKEAYDSLPPVLQRVVGNPGQLNTWGYMELDTVQSVIASNIGRSLRVLLDQERQAQRTGQHKPYIKAQIETRPGPAKIKKETTEADREALIAMIKKARGELRPTFEEREYNEADIEDLYLDPRKGDKHG